jgi:hypothetical protein
MPQVLTVSIIREMFAFMKEAISTSEALANFCDTTRRKIPEDRSLQKNE